MSTDRSQKPTTDRTSPDAADASAFVNAVDDRGDTAVARAGSGLAPGKPRPMNPVSRLISHPLFGVVVVVLAIALPFINSSAYAIRISTDALIFVMLAVGLNVVVGYCGLLDLGYAAFFAIGAYTAGVLTTTFGWPVIATIPCVVVAAVIGGLLIGGPTLRLRSDYLAIVTLGFGEIVRITANNLDFTGGPNGGVRHPRLRRLRAARRHRHLLGGGGRRGPRRARLGPAGPWATRPGLAFRT